MQPFLRELVLESSSVRSHWFDIPALQGLQRLSLDHPVIFFVGENGTGKSTLLEAIAVAAGLGSGGGSRNVNMEGSGHRREHHDGLGLVRNPRRESTEFFLKAETFHGLAAWLESLPGGVPNSYGQRPLGEQSHGESLLAVALNRFGPNGLYLLDEPEAALSPQHQLSLLARVNELVRDGSQFLIVTHSPILMAYPGAWIYELPATARIRRVNYEATEHFQLTRDFLNDRERYFRHLFGAT